MWSFDLALPIATLYNTVELKYSQLLGTVEFDGGGKIWGMISTNKTKIRGKTC